MACRTESDGAGYLGLFCQDRYKIESRYSSLVLWAPTSFNSEIYGTAKWGEMAHASVEAANLRKE